MPINDRYQVIFPPDVHYAVFHAKNPVTEYPLGKGDFGGNDYGAGTDLSWWVNSPAATSFFAAESRYEFFGGYDHAHHTGVVGEIEVETGHIVVNGDDGGFLTCEGNAADPGKPSSRNGELVAKARQMAEDVGRRPATVGEARELLGTRRMAWPPAPVAATA